MSRTREDVAVRLVGTRFRFQVRVGGADGYRTETDKRALVQSKVCRHRRPRATGLMQRQSVTGTWTGGNLKDEWNVVPGRGRGFVRSQRR